MYIPRTLENISERLLLSSCLKAVFRPILRLSSMEWATKYRSITSTETSFGIGKFDPDRTPYMEYLYDCLDNPYIPVIIGQKSSRIAWTETINNWLGKNIHTNPRNTLIGFPTKDKAKEYGKGKLQPLIENTPILQEAIDVGLSENKKSIFDYNLKGAWLRLRTLGSLVKSDNVPTIVVEEFADTPDNVNNQGDTVAALLDRQKLVPLVMRKFVGGSTPTNMDFCQVERAIKYSNQLVFKAECHECGELIAMDSTSFAAIKVAEFSERRLDEKYGRQDPFSAKFFCPACAAEWTFEQKNLNIRAGKKHGFVDHTGRFSKGWHPNKPEVTDTFGFIFSELLSPFDGGNFIELSKKRILAEVDHAKGKEGLLKAFYNTCMGVPYASGVSALSVEEMRKLRSNYPEGIIPSDGLVLTMGVDVQINRFAYVIRAWGRNGNSWLVTWREIFGNTQNYQDPVWEELKNVIIADYPHAGGKRLKISGCGIDSGWNTELVYRFVLEMNQIQGYEHVFATKGSDELRFSHDEIYNEPAEMDILTYKSARRSLAETMGVKVYNIGAHKAHNEILRRVGLNLIDGCNQDRYFFNEQSYGQYEDQMVSCRKLIDVRSGTQREVYKLVSGKRKEAMDAEKNVIWCAYAIGIPSYTAPHWKAIEQFLYS